MKLSLVPHQCLHIKCEYSSENILITVSFHICFSVLASQDHKWQVPVGDLRCLHMSNPDAYTEAILNSLWKIRMLKGAHE